MQKQQQRKAGMQSIAERPAARGQHLLHHQPVIHEMIKLAEITAADVVLDLGAGRGAITMPLAERAGKVLAIENDAALAAALRQKSALCHNVSVIERDIRDTYLPKEPFHVVANIPFFITTPILEKLLDPPNSPFQGAVLIVQHGAAKGLSSRMIRSPRLLIWRMWFDLELVKVVPRRHFSPPPRVDAAILRIRRRSAPRVEAKDRQTFAGLAEYGLAYPVMPVDEALAGIFTPVQIRLLLQQLKLDRKVPVCSLRERDWGVIFQTMREKVPPYRWPKRAKKKRGPG
ncbi:23S ribosomal RNA methyltransferase Erm [Paenibacillus jiagnxiensis]|uniref:23S ribosomal RNA methyltransferase Erm n=1 Tax=Paenibacillus jiagnxiensis TaxID=3228926 RepID=UPI0033AA247F